MAELILHHYEMSPFAEKARLMLGFKGLAWRSVLIPPVMPKPDVVALTGGYRKTPVLQIGADIYCDTALIARVLERLQPSPTLYPASAPLAPQLAQWADFNLFWCAAAWAMQPAGAAAIMAGQDLSTMKGFAADRAAMTGTMRRMTLADASVQLQAHLTALNAQCAQAAPQGPWLFGAQASIADFSVAHCLWFIHRAGPMGDILKPHTALLRWLHHVLAIGHGQRHPQELPSAEAVALAAHTAATTGHAACQVQPELGFAPNQPVQVYATDYGTDAVQGELVGLSPDEVVLRRTDERAGTVHVHFPRAGFQIKKVETPA